MNWKSPAGAWIPFLIRVEGRKSQRSFLLLKQSLVKSSYPEKIGLFKNEIRVVGVFFFTLQSCKFWGFSFAVGAAEWGARCVWRAEITQACSPAGAVRVDGLIQMDDICKKYAQVKNSQRSCSGQVFNFSFPRRIKLFC